MKRPVGLILTTVILGLIAFGQLFGAIVMVVSGVLVSRAPSHATGQDVPIPPHALGSFVLYFSLILSVICALFAAWSILTIVGLLRLRNWGRISVLILGGCMAVLGVLSTLGCILLLFAQSFLLPHSASEPSLPPHTMAFLFGLSALVYIFIAAIGIWWFIYFNRAAIKALFVLPATGAYAPGSYPASSLPPSGKPGRFQHVPIAIVIVSCLFLVSTVTCALMAFVPFPAFLLGFIVTGPVKYIAYLTLAAISGYIGYGLLHLDNRARLVTLGYLCFAFLNMGCIFLPWYRTQFNLYNQQMMQKFQIPGVPTTPMPDLSYVYMIFVAVFAILFNGFLFWLIQRHREAFLRVPPPPHQLEPQP